MPTVDGDAAAPAVSPETAAKQKAIIAAIVAARLAHAKETVEREERKQRTVTAEDLFGSSSDTARFDKREMGESKDKSERMQGVFGAKKFIKP